MGKLNSNEIPFNHPTQISGSPPLVSPTPQTSPLEQAYRIVSRPIEAPQHLSAGRGLTGFPLGLVFILIMVSAALLGLGLLAFKKFTLSQAMSPGAGGVARTAQSEASSGFAPNRSSYFRGDTAFPARASAASAIAAAVGSSGSIASPAKGTMIMPAETARAIQSNQVFDTLPMSNHTDPGARQEHRELPLLPDP